MPRNLQRDPTRTTMLRNKMVADMVRRFKALSREIEKLIIDEDIFGLIDRQPLTINLERQAWRFNTSAQKVKSFRGWLTEQVNSGILTVDGLGDPWTAPYIESAYKKGVVRSYTDTKRLGMIDDVDAFGLRRDEFLSSAFSSSEVTSKIELLYERAFTELKGVTDAMDQRMSRILATGLANGSSPRVIASQLRQDVTKLTNTRAKVIARTEIIRAHSEGQLDTFERLNVKEIGVLAEWSTAGDERVCPRCEPLEGMVLTIDEARDLLPRHPNCRCAWIPANVGEPITGQLWGKKAESAIDDSIKAEFPSERTLRTAKRRSIWAAKDLKPRTVPKKPVAKVAKKSTPAPVQRVDDTTPAEFWKGLSDDDKTILTSWVDSEATGGGGFGVWKEIRILERTKPHHAVAVKFNQLLDKAPQFKGTTYRVGVDRAEDPFKGILSKKDGSIIKIKTSASSTSVKSKTESFLDDAIGSSEVDNTAYVIKVKSKTGADTRNAFKKLGEFDESEVVLRKNTSYTIIKKVKKDDDFGGKYWEILIEEI